MSKNIRRHTGRRTIALQTSLAALAVSLSALSGVCLAGCGDKGEAAATGASQDPKAFDHDKKTSPEDLAKMQAYMKAHNTQGPPAGPAARASAVK